MEASNKVYAVVYFEQNWLDPSCVESPDSIWYDKTKAQERARLLNKNNNDDAWDWCEFEVR
jgi:hypothetical protein